MNPAKLVFAGNLLCAGFLTGLIWYVQVVHYPLFASVGRDGFARYHALHSSATTAVVIVPMLAELGLAALLVAIRPVGFPAPLAWLGLALVGAAWLATFALAVPLHGRLGASGFDADIITRLVRTNWVRTAAWSARFAILLYGVLRLLP